MRDARALLNVIAELGECSEWDVACCRLGGPGCITLEAAVVPGTVVPSPARQARLYAGFPVGAGDASTAGQSL